MALTLVLSVGLDPELLDTRNLVLQSAGYTVVAAFSPERPLIAYGKGTSTLSSCVSPFQQRTKTTWSSGFECPAGGSL